MGQSYIPDDIIQDVRRGSDIVEIVSDSVRLKRQGQNFSGLCPFHNEKTPSFVVSPDKQIFRCFGCGEGGNVFSFIMKRDNLSFPEAVHLLAKRAGIEVPESDDPVAIQESKKRKRFYEMNDLATNFFHYLLLNHKAGLEARNYIKKRQLTEETVEKFQIGFAPPNWDGLQQFMLKKGYTNEELEQAGLTIKKTKGSEGYYDRFRNRLMFPIKDIQGNVVGFGGRVLDDSQPKYLNSPETPLFNKGSLLYGLNNAIDGIKRNDKAVVVEGYMDVISCHQAEITNTVASLGTALTREQGKLILRYTQNIFMAYDTDSAGINATIRGWQVLNELGCRIRVLRLPESKDPDEYIRRNSAAAFLKIIAEDSLALSDFLTDKAMAKYDIYSLEGKFKIASEVIPNIRSLSNEIEKDEAINALAQRLHLSLDAVRAEVANYEQKTRNNWQSRDKITDKRDNKSNSDLKGFVKKKQDARAKAENCIVSLMLEDKKFLIGCSQNDLVLLKEQPEQGKIINELQNIIDKGMQYQTAVLFDTLKDEASLELLKSLAIADLAVKDKEKLFADCLNVVHEDELRKRREKLLKQIEQAERDKNPEVSQRLLLEYSKLI